MAEQNVTETEHAPDHYAIVGMGSTGVSSARFLRARGNRVSLLDSRADPPDAALVFKEFGDCDLYMGDLPAPLLSEADYLIVSPGVSLHAPAIEQALQSGAELTSDLDLFRASVSGRVVCITGSNGKTTVATLLSYIAEAAGLKTCLCGNIGTPVLDTVAEQAELYIVEVSSFQLERCSSLRPDISVVLNISADHMDRYSGIAEYRATKARIHEGSAHCLLNKDEDSHQCDDQPSYFFSAGNSSYGGYGIDSEEAGEFLACDGECILDVSTIAMRGRHNQLNALAAIALADGLGIPRSISCAAVKQFPGLPHRCETIAVHGGATYINDSKGTNPGATLAALRGLGQQEKNLILIAGGVGKQADFSVLFEAVRESVKQVIVFGQDGGDVADALAGAAPIAAADSLEQALQTAQAAADIGDQVLFSPACASFDMFENFEQRGDAFRALVHSLTDKECQQ